MLEPPWGFETPDLRITSCRRGVRLVGERTAGMVGPVRGTDDRHRWIRAVDLLPQVARSHNCGYHSSLVAVATGPASISGCGSDGGSMRGRGQKRCPRQDSQEKEPAS